MSNLKQYKVTLRQTVEVTGYINAEDNHALNDKLDMVDGCIIDALYGNTNIEYSDLEIVEVDNV